MDDERNCDGSAFQTVWAATLRRQDDAELAPCRAICHAYVTNCSRNA